MKGITQVDLEGFLQDYARSRMWTARFVRQFEDKDLSLQPGAGSMETRAQVLQILQSDNFVMSVLKDEVPSVEKFKRDYDVSTVKACLDSLKNGLKEVNQAALEISAEAWAQEVEPFGPEWRLTRGQMAYLMIDHESHHRGQLAVYLRVAGKTPDLLYAPVNEQVFDLNG